MKHRNSGYTLGISPLEAAAALARGADRLLTTVVGLFLLLVLAFAAFSLWDTWRIYDEAGVDETLLHFKPTEAGDNTAGFSDLAALSPDVRAWLTLDDTHIDYPVVQGEDNVKYVNTDVYGNFSLSGSIFLDYRNAADFSDAYCLLYGHHMDGDVMFGELARFLEADYFTSHPTGTLYLPEVTYTIEIFASLQTDAYDDLIFTPGNYAPEEMDKFLKETTANARQYREIGVTGQDHILALSTCSDASTNARTIVLGRLTEAAATQGGD